MNKVRTLARHGPAADLAQGKQPPSYAVVSETELENLKAFLEHDPMSAARKQASDRLALKEASEGRVKNWPNLIETIRLKKERERKERLEQEEETRMELDNQERQFQAQVRNDAIQKANQMLYRQEDRVKTFTSNLFLASVLDERAKQIEVNRQKKELVKQKDYEWSLAQQGQVERAEEEEEERTKKRRDAAQNLKQEQRSQLAEVRVRKLREREDARQEGRQIREAAERAIDKEREAEEVRRAKAMEINKQYIDENRRQRAQREVKLREEDQELKKIKLFAQLKEEQMLERKKRAEDKFNADLARRQHMITRQAEHLEAIAYEADERVLTQIRDAEKERQLKEEHAEAGRKKLWSSIEESRTRQLKMKDAAKRDAAETKKRISRLQETQQAMLMDEEIAQREDVRRKNEALQKFQKTQIDEANEKKATRRREELDEGTTMLKSFQEEEHLFQNYVASVMGPRSAKSTPTRGGSGGRGDSGSTASGHGRHADSASPNNPHPPGSTRSSTYSKGSR